MISWLHVNYMLFSSKSLSFKLKFKISEQELSKHNFAYHEGVNPTFLATVDNVYRETAYSVNPDKGLGRQ